jgi:molecular chaperone GrpE
MNKKQKNNGNADSFNEDFLENLKEDLSKDIPGEVEEPMQEGETSSEEKIEGDVLQQEKEKYLRLYSEFENFRRRTTKEKIELIQNASKDLVVDLLPMLDDFERALKALRASGNESAVEGMELIYKKFYGILEKRGLKAMTVIGEVFDVELHEALTQFEAPSEDLKGKVIDELEKGYYLNDKVVRFAKVVVGK